MTRRLAWLVGLVLAGPLPAQDLDRAEALAHEGRLGEARAEVLAWWNGPGVDGGSRGAAQQALWLRGLLTLDPSQAALDYMRLVVEHPGGRYTDRALLRLGRIAEAGGDPAAARRYFGILARDHPRSPVNAEARAWLARHPEAADDPRPARSREATPPPPGDPAASGGWSVQLGAFTQPERADELARLARDAGFEPRLVTTAGTDLVRVRVGRFPEAEGARELHSQLRARGFDALVVDDAAAERRIAGG